MLNALIPWGPGPASASGAASLCIHGPCWRNYMERRFSGKLFSNEITMSLAGHRRRQRCQRTGGFPLPTLLGGYVGNHPICPTVWSGDYRGPRKVLSGLEIVFFFFFFLFFFPLVERISGSRCKPNSLLPYSTSNPTK